MRDLFRSGSAAQFLLHGNVFDVVPAGGRLLSVPAFLEQVMFATYDVVLRYDRSRGVRAHAWQRRLGQSGCRARSAANRNR